MFNFTETNHDTFDVHSPYDGKLIEKLEAANEFDVEHALATAASVFRDRNQWLSKEKRLNILNKIVSITIDQVDEFALLITKESGKLLVESRNETLQSVDVIKKYAALVREELKKDNNISGQTIINDNKVLTIQEPTGIVVAVSSYIEPLKSIVELVIPAIVSGCPVIINPSAETPLSCFKFIKIISQADLPHGWCQVLASNRNDIVTQLISDERVKLFSYVGDVKNGWVFKSRLAPVTQSRMKLDGSTSVIVTSNSKTETILPIISKAAFKNAGQGFFSVQKVFVPVVIARKFAEGIAEIASQYVLGDPSSADTEVGPMINMFESSRVAQWVNEAVSAGAELICGGRKVSDSCYACTVLYKPSLQSKVSQFEIAGPVVCIYPYDDIQQAIHQLNNSPYNFRTGVFTEDKAEAQSISTQLNASSIFINHFNNIGTDSELNEGVNSVVDPVKEDRLYSIYKKLVKEKQ